jgi:hypothetical protein
MPKQHFGDTTARRLNDLAFLAKIPTWGCVLTECGYLAAKGFQPDSGAAALAAGIAFSAAAVIVAKVAAVTRENEVIAVYNERILDAQERRRRHLIQVAAELAELRDSAAHLPTVAGPHGIGGTAPYAPPQVRRRVSDPTLLPGLRARVTADLRAADDRRRLPEAPIERVPQNIPQVAHSGHGEHLTSSRSA